jgi:high-affinity Fe2+/Pb2+ permease
MRMKTLKFVGGGLIVACAFAIMLPDVITYLSGLWRIILLVVTIVLASSALVFVYHRVRAKSETNNKDNAAD